MTEKVLHLTIKRQWYDMIASGEKKEEYRDEKEFWIKRLFVNHREYFELQKKGKATSMFSRVKLYNGWACSEKYRNITLKVNGYEYREGRPEWGAEPGKKYFVIKLGEKI